MFNSKIFDEIAQKLSALVPTELQTMQKELEKNFRVVLQSCFSKMDLVTREEFDVQAQVLAKTRAKLEMLEQQLAKFEQDLKNQD